MTNTSKKNKSANTAVTNLKRATVLFIMLAIVTVVAAVAGNVYDDEELYTCYKYQSYINYSNDFRQPYEPDQTDFYHSYYNYADESYIGKAPSYLSYGDEGGYIGIHPIDYGVIVFNPNGGIHLGETDPNVVIALPQGTGTLPPAPVRTNFEFLNWTRTQSGNLEGHWTNNNNIATGITVTASSTFPENESPFHVYAQWGHMVSFIGNGIDLPNPHLTTAVGFGSRIIADGRTVNNSNAMHWAPAITWPDNPAHHLWYRFSGWAYTDTGGIDGNIVGIFDPNTTVVDRQLVLIAQWIPETPLTVTFDMQDGFLGTAGTGGSNVQQATRQVWYGSNINFDTRSVGQSATRRLNAGVAWARSAPDVLRTHPMPMTVQGWWTHRYGPYGSGNQWSLAGWDHVNNIHNGTGDPQTWNAGMSYFPHRGQWVAETNVYHDITVYPNWVYRVSFHPNGGTFTPGIAGISATEPRLRDVPVHRDGYGRYLGGTIRNHGRLPSNGLARNLPDINRAGHIFAGWWSHPIPTDVPLGQEYQHGFSDAYEFILDTLVYQNRNVYARWIAIAPTPTPTPTPVEYIYVHFDLNDGGRWWDAPGHLLPPDGETGIRSVQINRGSNVQYSRMPQFPIGNDGYIFMGWFDTPYGPARTATPPNLNVPSRFTASTVNHETRTVYAYWEPYVTLTVNPNGGGFTNPTLSPGSNHYIKVAQGRNFAQMQVIWSPWSSLPDASGRNSLRPIEWGFPRQDDFWNPIAGWTEFNRFSLLQRTTHPTFVRQEPGRFWSITQDGRGPFFNVNFQVNYDITIYAQWVTTITFDSNRSFFIGGSNATQVALIPAGTTMRESIIGFPGWSNQFADSTIIGWSTARDSTQGLTFSLDTRVDGPITVFAIWSAHLFFSSNGAPLSAIPEYHRFRQVIQVGLPMSGTFCPDNPSITGVPPHEDIEHNWPGHQFTGWNTQSDGYGTTVYNSTIVNEIRNFYAIWYGTVTFDGQGGTMRHTTHEPPGASTVLVHQRINNVIGSGRMPAELVRPGWHPARIPGTNDYYWAASPFSLVSGISVPFSPNTPVLRTQTVYAQWLAALHFISDSGIGSVNGQHSVTLDVPETGTVANNTPGMPTATSPGRDFSHWEVQIDTGSGYVWILFDGNTVICDIASAPFRRDDYGRIIVNARFVSAYTDFEFFKTDMAIYPEYESEYVDMNVVQFLYNARFHLYRWDSIENDWELINDNIRSAYDGRVQLQGLDVAASYRLREVEAPKGFTTPPVTSYWIIRFCHIYNVVDYVYAHGSALPFERIPNGYGYVFFVGNQEGIGFTFTFIKTDMGLYATPRNFNTLHGAIFRLYRQNTTYPEIWYPVPNPDTYLSGYYEATSNTYGEVRFTLTASGEYKLREIFGPPPQAGSPQGFRPPPPGSYWRIVFNTARDAIEEINSLGPDIPGFVEVPTLVYEDGEYIYVDIWHVGNPMEFQLPLTGGSGIARNIIMLTGMGIIVLAFGIMAYLKLKPARIY